MYVVIICTHTRVVLQSRCICVELSHKKSHFLETSKKWYETAKSDYDSLPSGLEGEPGDVVRQEDVPPSPTLETAATNADDY